MSVDKILSDAPAIHGEGADIITYGLHEAALRFIEAQVGPQSRTLETGSGFSTLTFAARGANHTVVVPNAFEVDRIREYAQAHDIALDSVTFVTEPSERALPGMTLESLDLVLIDGSHSFPQTFIDWFYTAEALKVGGWLLIDDVHIWTGRVLRDFLASEPEWFVTDELAGRTAVVRKVGQVDPDRVWTEQAYVVRKSGLKGPSQARMAYSMAKRGRLGQLKDELVSGAKRRLGR